MSEKKTEEKKKRKLTPNEKRKKRIKNLIIKFSILAVVLFVLLRFVVAIRVVHDNNMFPFIQDGELVVVYRLGKIAVTEAVLYEQDGQERLGRIVAQNGDKVEITENEYLINGSASYTSNPYPTRAPAGQTISVTVPENQYFILNDYRERETDSRTFGCVSHVIGPVVFSMKYRGF